MVTLFFDFIGYFFPPLRDVAVRVRQDSKGLSTGNLDFQTNALMRLPTPPASDMQNGGDEPSKNRGFDFPA